MSQLAPGQRQGRGHGAHEPALVHGVLVLPHAFCGTVAPGAHIAEIDGGAGGLVPDHEHRDVATGLAALGGEVGISEGIGGLQFRGVLPRRKLWWMLQWHRCLMVRGW